MAPYSSKHHHTSPGHCDWNSAFHGQNGGMGGQIVLQCRSTTSIDCLLSRCTVRGFLDLQCV
ncbi:hypothetical protein JHK82_052204 [Glycine max]|nr:hypothetical protein JHK86_052032 [Glycine max]KAG4926404.1 hypothetical protein JHK85_052890 [Glycine max]KAG5082039.1 hypothetical protein JHK84_052077 [Glycine max]KAG5084807.1 hypothetical protein JHK82_052204 [Glycine max]